MTSRLHVAAVLASVAFGVPCIAQRPDSIGRPGAVADSAAVAAAVERYGQALERGDSAAALALLSPDVVILESGGSETLAEYRSHHLPADMQFAQAVKGEQTPIRVVVRGDAAWAWRTGRSIGTYNTRPIDMSNAELMVLVRSGGEWKIAAIHWSSRQRRPRS